jgi:ELWxxDGT repeat protein
MGNVLYFGSTTESAAELWKSDGTYAGTMRVKQIRKGSNSSAPKSFTNVNGTVYFVADNGTGNELWKTNGTLSGT